MIPYDWTQLFNFNLFFDDKKKFLTYFIYTDAIIIRFLEILPAKLVIITMVEKIIIFKQSLELTVSKENEDDEVHGINHSPFVDSTLRLDGVKHDFIPILTCQHLDMRIKG